VLGTKGEEQRIPNSVEGRRQYVVGKVTFCSISEKDQTLKRESRKNGIVHYKEERGGMMTKLVRKALGPSQLLQQGSVPPKREFDMIGKQGGR